MAEAAERTKLGVITRPGRSTRKLRKYLAVIKINQRDWKEEALEKIKAELKMLFEELKVLRVVK